MRTNKMWTKKGMIEALHNRMFTLVSFDANGRRTLTYGGCSVVAIMEEALAQTKRGNTYMVFEGEVPTNGNSYDINDYRGGK